MAESSRRFQERLPCDVAGELFSQAGGAKITALRLRDLGLGGALVESPVPLQRGVSYELLARGGRFSARVARDVKTDPKAETYAYGLVFTLTREQEQRLTALVDELRRGLWS